MCLVATEQNILNAEKTRKIPGKIYAWKLLYGEASSGKSVVLVSKFWDYIWKPGWNKSDRQSLELSTNEKRQLQERDNAQIHRGIHVFLNRKDAMRYCGFSYKVVRVECYNKDLVARGKRWEHKEAVYMKVFLARDEYKSALTRKTIERKVKWLGINGDK